MNHFKAFCKATPKNEHGYVPDVIDMEFDTIRDQATVAYLRDLGNHEAADNYYFFSDDLKNEYYSAIEIVMQDEVDKFNQSIDDKKLVDDHKMISLCDPEYRWQHFNQAMYDAGHKESDFV